MGMIRVSEHAEEVIRTWAREKGTTMTGAVDSMLSALEVALTEPVKAARAGACGVLQDYLDKRLDRLERMIEDTAVDRLDGNGGPRDKSYFNVKVYVPWNTARELLYEFLPEDAPEFVSGASAALRQADDEFPVFIVDDKLWTEDSYGAKSLILNISPRVRQFLESHN